jgi:hypothetical protein
MSDLDEYFFNWLIQNQVYKHRLLITQLMDDVMHAVEAKDNGGSELGFDDFPITIMHFGNRVPPEIAVTTIKEHNMNKHKWHSTSDDKDATSIRCLHGDSEFRCSLEIQEDDMEEIKESFDDGDQIVVYAIFPAGIREWVTFVRGFDLGDEDEDDADDEDSDDERKGKGTRTFLVDDKTLRMVEIFDGDVIDHCERVEANQRLNKVDM